MTHDVGDMTSAHKEIDIRETPTGKVIAFTAAQTNMIANTKGVPPTLNAIDLYDGNLFD